jgi:uncharacterized membrane protein
VNGTLYFLYTRPTEGGDPVSQSVSSLVAKCVMLRFWCVVCCSVLSLLNQAASKLYSIRVYIYIYIMIISSTQPLGQFWQEPEVSQATGMALARCILGKFLGVVCHCFPLPLDVPTFAARCLHVSINASERWNCGREWSDNFAEITPFSRHLGIFYMPQICDMELTALLPFRRKAC